MDSRYQQIALLTSEYIDLNEQFIEAVKLLRPAVELCVLKEKVKIILEKIQALENLDSRFMEQPGDPRPLA